MGNCLRKYSHNLVNSHSQMIKISFSYKFLFIGILQLDAFSNPHLKKENDVTQKLLSETKNLLDDARLACGHLEEKLLEKDEYYAKREKDLQELHRCEMSKGIKKELSSLLFAVN